MPPVTRGKAKSVKQVNKQESPVVKKAKRSPDTNNNAKKSKDTEGKNLFHKTSAPTKSVINRTKTVKNTPKSYNKDSSTNNKESVTKENVPLPLRPRSKRIRKLLENNRSCCILDDKAQKKDASNVDVYEFTYDPTEEPVPQKKKRKRTVKKKVAQPKSFVYKCSYDKNVSKALAALKNIVANKPKLQPVIDIERSANEHKNRPLRIEVSDEKAKEIQTVEQDHTKTAKDVPEKVLSQSNTSANITPHLVKESNSNIPAKNNYVSIAIEDIALDFELSDNHNDINYSPVNSPSHSRANHTESMSSTIAEDREKDYLDNEYLDNDPLNLREELSFFDDNPVASSSMNVSTRQPAASPWRAEFENLPIKWKVTSYVKPNMTPAVESSYVNFDNSKTKHVYTNIVPLAANALLDMENNPPIMKQSSILNFIKKKVQEKSAQKMKRARSVSPAKVNLIFEDFPNTHLNDNLEVVEKTPKKHAEKVLENKSPVKENLPITLPYLASNDNIINEKEKSSRIRKHKMNDENNKVPKKILKQKTNKNCTYFGFDDSENLDLENLSPIKDNPRVKALRPRARAVLQEINAQTKPMRAAIPVTAKSKIAVTNEAVNKAYEIKSATDAPIFPDKSLEQNLESTNVDDPSWRENSYDDPQSVHLFEDIDVVHHLKPTRKSYGKVKKVAFQTHNSNSNIEVSDNESIGDEHADLTFNFANIKEKKKTKRKKPKKLLSKEEEREVEAWAAGFNSMCEDVDDFPLIIE